eukprot:3752850-Pleurochrysis_carterae.AAC.1
MSSRGRFRSKASSASHLNRPKQTFSPPRPQSTAHVPAAVLSWRDQPCMHFSLHAYVSLGTMSRKNYGCPSSPLTPPPCCLHQLAAPDCAAIP